MVDWRIHHEFTGDRLDAMDQREFVLHVLGNEAGKNIGGITRQNGEIGAALVCSLADTAFYAIRKRDQTQRGSDGEADAKGDDDGTCGSPPKVAERECD